MAIIQRGKSAKNKSAKNKSKKYNQLDLFAE
jgi:hypothetical protein